MKKLFLTAAMVVGALTDYSPAIAAEQISLYTAVRGGASFAQISDAHFRTYSIFTVRNDRIEADAKDTRAYGSIAGGWTFSKYGLRGEVEVSFSSETTFNDRYDQHLAIPPLALPATRTDIRIAPSATTILAMLYKDISISNDVNLFGGAGAGISFMSATTTQSAGALRDFTQHFHKPVIAIAVGGSWQTTPALALEARYLHMSSSSFDISTPISVTPLGVSSTYYSYRLQQQIVTVGLRYQF